MIFFVQLSFTQKPSDNNSKRIVKNWAAAQTGTVLGWLSTSVTFYLLEEMEIIDYNSTANKNNVRIITAMSVSHLTCNLILKREAHQNKMVFLKNMLFSSVPVVVYGLWVKPKLATKLTVTELKKDTGLVLISMLVTPVFSTIGNEIFNKHQKPNKKQVLFQIKNYSTDHNGGTYLFGLKYNL